MPGLTKLWILCAVIVGLLVATGCGSDSDSGSSDNSTTTTAAKVAGNINVSAAASLTEAFAEIGADFEQANPDATATFNPGPSSTLATQIEQGAAVDTFASADEANMTRLVDANLIDGQPVVFATNRLDHRHQARQPEERGEPRRPGDRRCRLALWRNRPVRQVRGPDPADCGRDDRRNQCDPRGRREGDARGGHDRRRRSCHRVRHRREERRKLARHRQDPRLAERHREVPDRDRRDEQQQGDVAGVRRRTSCRRRARRH